MKDPFSRYVETATQVTRDTAERIVRSILKPGEEQEAAEERVHDPRERSQENREGIADLVRSETKRVISAMGLATRDDVERLERQIAELRQRVSGQMAAERPQAETPSGTRETAKKAAARRTAKKADTADAPVTATKRETARKVATAPEAKRTAAERTRSPGEAAGSGESPPLPEAPMSDAETTGTASGAGPAGPEDDG